MSAAITKAPDFIDWQRAGAILTRNEYDSLIALFGWKQRTCRQCAGDWTDAIGVENDLCPHCMGE